MSSFTFQSVVRPFPRWMGPFSPARGTRSGFRFHQGRLGTWVGDDSGRAFWSVADDPGAREIAKVVRGVWGGGRVLLLPNGFAVKPLQTDDEVGQRVFIGEFSGSLVLEKPDSTVFDFSNPGTLRAGQHWPGPTTTGLECIIRSDGSLKCSWYHPTRSGRDTVSKNLQGPDQKLGAGFRACRPGQQTGRVRLTANGHVITNRQSRDGTWTTIYVGWIDTRRWTDWKDWCEKEYT
jgi:hypothetical protein